MLQRVRTSRRGNRYDNARAGRFIKTFKVEAVYPMAHEAFEGVAEDVPRFLEQVHNRRCLPSALEYLGPAQFEEQQPGPPVKTAA